MLKAYRQLRKHSHQTRLGCVRFQIRTWILDLKWWPRHAITNLRLRRAAKKDPEGFKRALDMLKEIVDSK